MTLNYEDLKLAFEPDKTIVVILENNAENPMKIEEYRKEIEKMFKKLKTVRFGMNLIKFENGSVIYFIPYRSKTFRGLHADAIIYCNYKLYINANEFSRREVYPIINNKCVVTHWKW